MSRMTRLSAVLAVLALAACSAATAPATPVAGDHTIGSATAKVQLLEYSDYQCPACGFFYPITKQIAERYKDRVSFTVRHFPLENLHKNALAASEAAEAAGAQGKYFEMHDKLFEGQKEWSDLADPVPTFATYAGQIGLDVAKFTSEVNAKKYESAIRASYARGIGLGVNSTPTFFLNGKKLTDTPRTYGAFQALIDAALIEAGAPASSVTPSAEVPTSPAPASSVSTPE